MWTTNDWNTPERVLEPIRQFYGGEISLDPVSNETSIVKAERNYTREDNSLARSWNLYPGSGRNTFIFCNSPYSKPNLELFSRKAKTEFNLSPREIEIILLIPVYSSTKWWQENVCGQPICFLNKRVQFLGPKKGSPTFHSCLVYYGMRQVEFAEFFSPRLGYVAQ